MPTILTHAFTGAACAGLYQTICGRRMSKRFWIISIVAPMVPDADVIAFLFGIPYEHMFGHRGFSHSLLFAVLLSTYLLWRYFPFPETAKRERRLLAAYFTTLLASHGLLDALTNGGLGIALFSPFDPTRYFFPWRPILVSPIGLRAFLSEWGMRVLLNEMLWVWLPTVVLVLLCFGASRMRAVRPYRRK